MVIRTGSNGKFLACSAFPKCRNTKSLDEETTHKQVKNEQIESDELVYTFYKAMIDYLNDRELVLLIDDGCLDDGLAMAFYKDKEKLYFEMIYRDGKEPFEIEEKLFWYYPYNSKVTKEEQREFNNAVEEYITFNKDLLKKVGK